MAGGYHFRNLVFEGGGVKGVAYVGVTRELGKRGILANVERIAGTSAGAINAVLLATGHGQRETTSILLGLDFRNFLEDSWGLVRDTRRLA
ncbi:MAG: patatin, partial [Woeseiaceae bacterium]|nr:patatin [Woeseiaceae bacterium]NIP22125.1 patatin [Woeseiaceae bacterium]